MVLMVMLMTVSLMSMAQDLDEIIAKHIEAHGGAEKWDAVESMKIIGRYTAFSVEEDFYAYKTKEGGYYSQLELGKYHVEEAFDGEKGWTIDPWQDFVFPRELNNHEVNVFYQKAEFFTPLYKYKEKDINVEFVGKDNLDGVEVYVLMVTRPNRRTETWYLDANTYLEVKCESNWVDFAYRSPAESYFDDFRTVEGVVIPFFIERTFSQRDRILQIEEVILNVPVDENLLMMPQSQQMSQLDFLVGEWDVQVELYYAPRNLWYVADKTSSTIGFQSTNLLKEEISYNSVFVQNKLVYYSYYAPGEQYRMTLYNAFDSNIEVYAGDFGDSAFVYSNIPKYTVDTTLNTNYTQYAFQKITNDSLVLSISASDDRGENWTQQEKLTYVRMKE
jgi:hypothetical protein